MAIQTNKDVTEITYNGVNVPLYHKTQTKSTTITSNGTTTISKDADYDGMASIEITTNVPTPAPSLQDITITENGTYTHAGYDGYDEVVVNVSGGGGVEVEPLSVTENGTYTAPTGTAYSPVTVNVSGGGGRTEAVSKDINFYDYDGFRVDSWTLAELSSKTSLPANPTHDGLTAQGWNWTLAQLQSANRQVDVGQTYTTTNGATYIHVTLDEGSLTPILGVGQSTANGLLINWGDGSAEESSGSATGTTTPIAISHTYASAGDYIIKILPQGSAKLYLYGSTSGCNIVYDANNPYLYSTRISEINIGSNVTIYANAFYNAYGCSKISIPIGTAYSGACMQHNRFEALVFPSGANPSTANFMRNSYNLKMISMASNQEMQQSMVSAAYALKRFSFSYSASRISANSFADAFALSHLDIPTNITTILKNGFADAEGLREIKFYRSTPPTAQDSTAFAGLPTYCTIYVPSGSLSAYTSAANYPSSSTYTYVEY